MAGKVEIHCCSRFSFDEFERWQPEQVKAFLGGIASIVAADKVERRVATPGPSTPDGTPTEEPVT